jgi:sugar transferase (PEP-CTERM/EpsH1 system associated)
VAVVSSFGADDKPLIAHAIFRLDVGGMENGLVNLINHLPRDRYRHAIICLSESSDFEQRIRAENVTVHALRKREGKDPLIYLRFWHLLRKLKPAILHTRNLGTLDLAPVALMARVPVRIHGEHGWDASDPAGQSSKYRLLRRVCDLAVTDYIAVSNDIAAWLRDVIGIREDRIQQIYNGVDIDTFRPGGRQAELPFNEPRDKLLIVGTVGRMDPIKNLDRLIEAIAQMIDLDSSLRKKLRLVMVGDGSLLSEIREMVTKAGLLDLVWLPGRRHDVPELLRSMDIFVLPSRNEGISNTILESMATRLPIVASDVGGNRELISDSESGSLVKANDTDAIVSALARYVRDSDLRKSHGLAARRRAKECFSLRAMVQDYAKLYDRLLSSRQLNKIH